MVGVWSIFLARMWATSTASLTGSRYLAFFSLVGFFLAELILLVEGRPAVGGAWQNSAYS